MPQTIWVTIDSREKFQVRTDISGRCGICIGQEFRAREVDWIHGKKLAKGAETPWMRLRIERTEGAGPSRGTYVHHCTRLDTPAPEHCQGDLF